MNRIVALCRSRRFRFVGLAALAICALIVAGAWLMHFDEYWRFASVEPGMSEDEVLQVIGKPPGEYGPAGAKYGRAICFTWPQESFKNLSWGGYHGQLEVGINAKGTVTRVKLWRRMTEWDQWRTRWFGQAPRILSNAPALYVWEKVAPPRGAS